MSTPIEHLDVPLGERHAPHNWEYADATAREAATGFTPDDVGNVALQLDDYSRWTLIDDDPVTWQGDTSGTTPGGSAGGDLAGTYPNPTVNQARGLRETTGPTTLAMGAVADGEFLKRVGTDVVGASPGGGGLGDVVGPSSSVDAEIALFDNTTGKLLKRATGSGFVKATSGVYSTEANPTTGLPFDYAVAVSDETTSITTGAAKITFYFPVAVNITGVSAGLSTQSSSGTVTVDVNKNGSTIFSTTLTIDANEDTSHTAATPAALSSSPTAFAVTDKVTIDIDGAGTGAKGLKISFTGTRQ